jgi:hypothetical protein
MTSLVLRDFILESLTTCVNAPLGCFHKQVDWFSSLEVQVSSIALNDMNQNKSIYMCKSLFGHLESQDHSETHFRSSTQ